MRRASCSIALPVQTRKLTNRRELPNITSSGLDWEAFRLEAHRLVDHIADRHKSAEIHSVGVSAPCVGSHWSGRANLSVFEKSLASKDSPPAPFASVVSDVLSISPGLVDWQAKGFLSFFPGQLSPAAMLGEMLALSYNHAGFSWSTCPASTELEMLVVNAIGRWLGLPDSFLFCPDGNGGGAIHPNATEGLFVAMVAAREEKNKKRGLSRSNEMICYTSDQSHFSVEKACKMAGITIRKIKTVLDPHIENYPLHPLLLEEAIAEDMMNGRIPCMIVGTVGTTATCAIDPTRQLSAIARKSGAWLHIDAAYAGAAALCPEMRPVVFDGIELCDSVSVNGSKWMAMSMGCSFLLTRHMPLITSALACGASYIPTSPSRIHDLKDVTVGMARPWVSLRVYAVLRCVGLDALQGMIRRHIILAEYLDERLRKHPAIDCAVRPVLGLVVFRVRMMSNEDNIELQRRLSSHRNILVGSSQVNSQVVLRISLAHIKLTYEDIDNIHKAIVEEVNLMLAPNEH